MQINKKLAINGGEPTLDFSLSPYKSLGKKESDYVNKVLGSQNLSGFYGSPGENFYGGKYVRELEKRWCERFGCKYAVSINSNTSGLFAAIGALGLNPGEEIIMPALTMSATAVAPLFWGVIPDFVDVDRETYTLDIDEVESSINKNTKAIMAVNLFGHPAKLHELKSLALKRGLYLIEDNAQAPLGSEDGELCGTIGDIGVFSLNVHKHIHSGEGGICVTNNEELAKRLALIRNHGENVHEWLNFDSPANLIGLNLRMTELSAAVAISQLEDINMHVEKREKIAKKLSDACKNLKGIIPPKVRINCRHNYYCWVLRIDEDILGVNRNAFSRALLAEGFPHTEGYIEPLYMLPTFKNKLAIGNRGWPFTLSNKNYIEGLCPISESLHKKEILFFEPCAWELDDNVLDLLCESIVKVHKNLEQLV